LTRGKTAKNVFTLGTGNIPLMFDYAPPASEVIGSELREKQCSWIQENLTRTRCEVFWQPVSSCRTVQNCETVHRRTVESVAHFATDADFGAISAEVSAGIGVL
jgi:hypothetical protein